MELIRINDETEIISSDRDFVEIAREFISDDFAEVLEGRLNKPLEISDKLRKEVLENSDYYSYEASLDDFNSLGNDIVEICEEKIDYLENAKRIDKKVLIDSLEYILKELNQFI